MAILYFIGDTDGTRNVFRVALESSALYQVTDVNTGVSGVAPTSPALSVARDGSSLAFTVYERGRPRLSVLNGSTALAGAPVTALATAPPIHQPSRVWPAMWSIAC